MHWQAKRKSRKPVAAQSKIGNLAGLQLKLQLVSDQGDKLRIRGFSLGIADSIPEKSLQSVQVASVPGFFVGEGLLPVAAGLRVLDSADHAW